MNEQEDADELRILGLNNFSDKSVTLYGLTVPAAFNLTLYKPGQPISATVLVVVDPDRGPVPQGILVNSTSAKGYTYKDAVKLLRGAPVDELLHQAVLDSARSLRWNTEREVIGKPAGIGMTQEEAHRVAALVQQLEPQIQAVPTPQRRRTITKALLEEVAGVYRKALEDGVPPTQAVSDHFEATHARAARWVREARKASILGPAVGPTGGEAVPPVAEE